MGKGKGGKRRGKRARHGGALSQPGMKPKRKCCVSRPRCRRCPLRMLQEGTLPPGYGVRHRRLVRLDD